MTPTPFKLKPVDESFFENAPVRLTKTLSIERPAADVWAELVGDDPLHWCKALDGVKWTSERPFGVGTTRRVKALKGINVFDEYFFRWEEGRRKSFYVERASGPLAKRFAEDYLVEPNGENSCSFTWVVAYEPSLIGRVGEAFNKRILGTLFSDTAKYFAKS